MNKQIFLSAVAALTLASAANADTVSVRFDGVSPRQDVDFSIDGGATFHSTQAGYFHWVRQGGTYAGQGASGEFTTFCIDVNQHIGGGNTYDYEVRDPADAPLPGEGMGSARADQLAELFGRFFADSFDDMHAAAFQSAVWEIVYDDGLRLDLGDFQIDGHGDTLTAAQDMLDTIDGFGPRLQLLAMTSETVQDQIFLVPAPTSGLLLTLGLVASARRRRRQ